MASEITIETNDDIEDVKAAMGSSIEIEESSPDTETEEETPPVKPAKQAKEAAPKDEPEDDENEPEEPSEEPEEAAEELPVKKVPQTVPRARLNEEIRRRKELERQLEEHQAEAETPEPESDEGAEPDRPQFFSGEAEPQIEDFLKTVDEFDPKAMAKATADFTKAHFTWERKEARAEADYNRQVEEAQRRQAELTADFIDRRDAFAEADPEYNELVPNSQVQLSKFQELYVYESEVGPQILLYAVKHPKEMGRIAKMQVASQSKAMIALEAKLVEEYGVPAEPEEEVVTPKKAAVTPPPPKKTISKAPPPPARLKATGPGPRSERELAGPEDKVGVDLEYNPELERMDKARRGT